MSLLQSPLVTEPQNLWRKVVFVQRVSFAVVSSEAAYRFVYFALTLCILLCGMRSGAAEGVVHYSEGLPSIYSSFMVYGFSTSA